MNGFERPPLQNATETPTEPDPIIEIFFKIPYSK